MSLSKLARKVTLLAFLLALGVAFAPQLVSTAIAQEGGDDGEDEGGGLNEAQKKELDSITKTQQKANEAIESKDYEAGVKIFKKLCDKMDQAKLPEKITKSPRFVMLRYNAHYNYACCLSRTGAKEDAVKEFYRSVELGFMDWKHIAADDDLDALRDMDSFKKALADGKQLEIDRLVAQVKSGKSPCELPFEGLGSDDKKRNLATYKGKVLVVILASAEEDESIGNELAVLQKASDELKGKGVEILALVFGAEKETLKAMAEKHKVKFDMAICEPTDSLRPALMTGSQFFVIDKSGKVRAGAPAIYQPEAVIAAVKPLLEEAGSPDDKKDEGKKDDGKKDEKDKKKTEDF